MASNSYTDINNNMSIDDIMNSLHSNLEEVLKISLGPFIDKFNKCNNQINIVSDVLKQLPEYQELLNKNHILQKENDILKQHIINLETEYASNDVIKLNITEKDENIESIDLKNNSDVLDVNSDDESLTESEIDDDEISNNETSNIPRTITQDNVLERSDEIDSKKK